MGKGARTMGHMEPAARGVFGAMRQVFRGRDISRLETEDRPQPPEPPRQIANVPLPERVKLACEAIPLSETEKRVITALLKQPGAASKALSDACGWGGAVWHTHFAAMCQKRAAWLWPTGQSDEPDARFLPGVLADYDAHRGTFRLRSDVASAFRGLGLG